MFYKRIPSICQKLREKSKNSFSTSSTAQYKVVVIGAAGSTGQPLSLLLKSNPMVTRLALYDIVPMIGGVTLDVSHINNCTCVEGYLGTQQLGYALYGAHVVIVCAGVHKGSRMELFQTNAQIMYDLACAISVCCPCAAVGIITAPVNALVPLTAMVMYKNCVYDPRKYFGISTVDLMRASKYVSEINCSNPLIQYVPCIGGHDDFTTIPLLSKSNPPVFLSDEERKRLSERISKAGSVVAKAKGTGPATLSVAFAANRLTTAILRGFSGESNIVDCSYVRSNVTDCCYFASPLLFGPEGVQEIYSLAPMNAYEQSLLKKVTPHLKEAIKLGEKFVLKKTGEM